MKNHLTLQKQTQGKFDILKFILSFAIVALHTKIFPQILFPWLRLAVPLFFITTGYFLFKKTDTLNDEKAKTKVMKNFIKRNLQLYAFWFILLLPFTLFLKRKYYIQNNFFINIYNFLADLIFCETFTASWYIMACVIGATIIFIASKKAGNPSCQKHQKNNRNPKHHIPQFWNKFLYDKKTNTKVLFILSFIFYILLTINSCYSPLYNYGIIAQITRAYRTIINPFTSFPVSLFWLMCGKCFAEDVFNFKKITYIITTAISAILFYGEWLFVRSITGEYKNDAYFFMSFLCIGIFGLILNLPSKNKNTTQINTIYLRHFSVVLYAMHGTFSKILLALSIKIIGYETNLLVFLLVTLLCTTTYIIIELLLKFKNKNKVIALLKYSY